MNKALLSMSLVSDCVANDINVSVILDKNVIFSSSISNLSTKILHEFSDTESDHLLIIQMSGKNAEHTQIDSNGDILKDCLLSIKDIEIDGININQIFYEIAKYKHDFNGTKDLVIDKFYGIMGCNGQVELKFSTPIYLWLLENM